MSPINGSAFLQHLIAQTRQNVDFLISQNQISPAAGREILDRLPDPVAALTSRTSSLLITPPSPRPPSPTGYQPGSRDYSEPPPGAVRAKALWGYNEDGQDPQDLTFHAGDVIEIVQETNVDWWTGRYKGREGLFPSNYVEKLPPVSLPPRPSPSPRPSYDTPPPISPPPTAPSYPSYAPSYAPFYAPPPGPPGGYQGPPPPNPSYSPYAAPPPVPVSAAPPPTVIEPQKKPSKFGGLGNTLAHSAAGGVGFGAGSAVGSGIINSIF